MKKTSTSLLIIFAVVGAIFFGSLSAATAVTTKKWYTKVSSYKKVRKAAKKKNKPYILFFYTDWCGYCKKINKKYLSNAKVKKVLSRHYKVKINPDKSKGKKALAERKGVNGFPDFRVVLPNGGSIRIHPFQQGGAWSVKKFTAALKAALAAGR